ncbi:ComF family protein [Neomoorella mulderi]|uniref:DNA utilization protein GntX n=1 Tax=Moorella mulderi DSM 14980 TaxID=1122241 RepID=A0A151AV48_9FIRM|nr:ComF family protein [Moorella mulderi]KYH31442.1 DNA utilization protein GntX [Moorella mulderi DSM 14980]
MLLSWLFPRGKACAWCGRPVHQGFFCTSCRQQLQAWQQHYHPCLYCGRLLPLGKQAVCSQCREELPPFYKARAVGPYQGLLKEMIWALKYQGRRSLANPLGRLLAGVVVRELGPGRPDLVIPVPLTSTRLRVRTFNQAELLALALGQELGLPVNGEVMFRVRETAPQVNLSRRSRWQNLGGAFQVTAPGKITGRRLLLVDDVLTTGATASACTNALLAAGAAGVAVITLATGIENLPCFSP